eukprot:1549480-Prymnesium_polylepis.1
MYLLLGGVTCARSMRRRRGIRSAAPDPAPCRTQSPPSAAARAPARGLPAAARTARSDPAATARRGSRAPRKSPPVARPSCRGAREWRLPPAWSSRRSARASGGKSWR